MDGRGVYSGCFCEVVENRGFVFAGVRKSAKEREGSIENKGVSEHCWSRNFRKCEVAENEWVIGSEMWKGEWGDAVRLTEGVVRNTNGSYHRRHVPVKEVRRKVVQ